MYTASHTFGDYWEKLIKEPLLFRCNDQQTKCSNQKVLPQQKSTIPPLIQHKLPEYLNLSREEDELHSPQTESMTKQLRKKPLAKTTQTMNGD
jgi:hypothetical protein